MIVYSTVFEPRGSFTSLKWNILYSESNYEKEIVIKNSNKLSAKHFSDKYH